MTDPIVQTKTCPISGKEFTITQGDLNFYDKISPTFAGQKFQIPTPTLHPEERQRRRLSFRNERNLYRRKCDASGKDIISIYAPKEVLLGDSPDPAASDGTGKSFKVYDQKIRRSDARNPMDYGRDFDFSKTFTENFRKLMLKVPLSSQFNTNSENSDYCNHVGYMKNCYLCSASWNCENVFFASKVFEIKDSIDLLNCTNVSYGYQLINCENCYLGSFLLDCNNCNNSSFLINCNGCDFCFMSYNLTNQKYIFCNQQLTKEEYERQIKNITIRLGWDLFTQYNIIISNYRTNMIINSENSSGHRLTNVKNCLDCYNITNAKDCKFIGNGGEICEDVYDGFGVGYNQSLGYEIVDTGLNSTRNLFTIVTHRSHNMLYTFGCYDSSNLFGCIGLRNKSYCIFNKQYTKEQYEILVAKIITHMIETKERGEFFHPSLSPFGYNETVAQEYYPLEKVTSGKLQAIKTGDLKLETGSTSGFESFGYHRSDYQAPAPVADKIIEGKDLPTTIDEVSDDILKTAIRCEVTGKLFRIIPQELAFYRKHHLPLPRRHPDQRHLDRLALRK